MTRISWTSRFYGFCRKKREPTSGLEPLTSSLYKCTRFCGAGSSISGRPAPRILSAYVLCFILLDSRHCQRERWCVTWCIERLAVNSAPIPHRSLGIALRFTSKSSKEENRRADSNRLPLLITNVLLTREGAAADASLLVLSTVFLCGDLSLFSVRAARNLS